MIRIGFERLQAHCEHPPRDGAHVIVLILCERPELIRQRRRQADTELLTGESFHFITSSKHNMNRLRLRRLGSEIPSVVDSPVLVPLSNRTSQRAANRRGKAVTNNKRHTGSLSESTETDTTGAWLEILRFGLCGCAVVAVA
jgi:hypothetical protein